MKTPHDREIDRLIRQLALDSAKPPAERNKLGQFATPTVLARELLVYALTLIPPDQRLRFLDPAVGTGAFFSALLAAGAGERIDQALGFEIDPHYGEPAKMIWQGTALQVQIADFTAVKPPAAGVNLLVSNPPYVRHHHLDAHTKQRLLALGEQASGMALSGLAGLYAHFMAIAHRWMAPGAIACWLIPSEFMDVNYGREVKRYLRERVTLLRVHRFDPVDAQFDDALVSSAVVWLRNNPPPPGHAVDFSYGGTHSQPRVRRDVLLSALAQATKWTRFPVLGIQSNHDRPRLKDLFDVRRGIATGDNGFFILSAERVNELGLPWDQMTPVLPSPRYLKSDRIDADGNGNPIVERPQFLVDCRLPETVVRGRYPALWAYFEGGRDAMLQRYICAHRPLWYLQESRAAAPFLCTYMGRTDGGQAKPFRFLLNRSRAVVANTYLNLYPKPHVAQRLAENPALGVQVWEALNQLDPADMLAEGRVYGGGLHKIEPKELAQVPVEALADLLGLTGQAALALAA